MNIIPCGPRVLVKPEKLVNEDPVYKSAVAAGLQLPDVATRLEQNAMDKGTVVAIGPIAFKDYIDGQDWCKVGDKIAFAKYGGKIIGDFIVLNDSDVVAILRD